MDAAWLWLCAGLLLAIAELVAPGVFLVWIGAAALITGLLTLASGVGLTIQLGLFAASAIALIQVARVWIAHNPGAPGDPLLNDRAARLLGRVVRVIEPIGEADGRVAVEDGAWPARGAPALPGEWVRIVAVEGGCLLVVPLADALIAEHPR